MTDRHFLDLSETCSYMVHFPKKNKEHKYIMKVDQRNHLYYIKINVFMSIPMSV